MPEEAKEGDTIAVKYTGKLPDGTVFDSNEGADPLKFTVGQGEVIKGFDEAVKGLGPGTKTTVEVTPDEAYGARDEELVIPVKTEIFGETEPQPGMEVALRGRDGMVFNGRVTELNGDTVKVDLNHPLAGQTLVFDIEVVNIE